MHARAGTKHPVLIIGGGGRADADILPALSAREDVHIVGLVEPREDQLHHIADKHAISNRYTRWEDVPSDVGAFPTRPVAIIATPPWTHKNVYLPLSRAGWHVYCEKPLAYAMDDAVRIAEAADENPGITMIGFDRRFGAIAKLIKELSTKLGAPHFVHASKSKPDRPERERMLIENAVHVIDLLCAVVDHPVKRVQSIGRSFDEAGLREKKIGAVVEFANGTIGSFHQVRVGGGSIERVEAYGSGWTVTTSASGLIEVFAPSEILSDLQNSQLQPVSGLKHTYTVIRKGRTIDMALDAFFTAIEQEKPSPVSAASALITQQVVDTILREAGLMPL